MMDALAALTGGARTAPTPSKIPGLQIRFNAAVALAASAPRAPAWTY